MPKKKSRSKKKRRDDDDDDEDREYAEKWEPSKGESISGPIVRRETVDTEYGKGKLVVIEDDDDGEEYAVWCGTVLRKKLYSKYDEGDEVTVTYKGKQGKGKFAKKLFSVEGPDDDDDDDDEDDEDDD